MLSHRWRQREVYNISFVDSVHFVTFLDSQSSFGLILSSILLGRHFPRVSQFSSSYYYTISCLQWRNFRRKLLRYLIKLPTVVDSAALHERSHVSYGSWLLQISSFAWCWAFVIAQNALTRLKNIVGSWLLLHSRFLGMDHVLCSVVGVSLRCRCQKMAKGIAQNAHLGEEAKFLQVVV